MTERMARRPDAGAAEQVDRVLARDDLLQLARDAEQAVGIVRQRESLARRAENEPDVFGLALRHYLAETASRRSAIRAQAWSYAATIVCFCERLGIPVSSPHSAEEMYAFAAGELDGGPRTGFGADGLDQDLTLGVFNTHRRARNLRLRGRYAEALQLVVVPVEDLFGTGAEPHAAHYLYEAGACLIAAGQAAQVPSALGERDRYWTETRAAGFSTRHRLDLVRGLASLTEAVDAVQRGEDRASQGTAYDGEREYEEWDGAEPPLSVEFQVRPLTAHMLSYRIEVRSRADRLVIHDVTLNRGNCGMAEPGELNEGLKLPVALRYGQKKIVNVRRCDKVLEATVDTQYGAYTFNWR